MSEFLPIALVPREDRKREDIVAVLAAVLEKAQAGGYSDVTILATTPDREVELSHSGCDDLFALSGRLARLQHNVQRRMDGGA